MALKLKSKTTAVASALAVSGGVVAGLANMAEIAAFMREFGPLTIEDMNQALITYPWAFGSAAITGGVVLGALTNRFFLRRKQMGELEAQREHFEGMVEQIHVNRHGFEDTQRNFLAKLENQLVNKRMDNPKLCNFFGVEMHYALDDIETYFSDVEGIVCRASFYGMDEDGTLHPQAQHSRAGERERCNLCNEELRFSTGMTRVLEIAPQAKGRPLYKAEDIARTEPGWKDAETDDHEKLYDSAITVAVQLRPKHNSNLGKFRGTAPKARVLAGFLVLEVQADAFRTPGIDDAIASFADRLFDALVHISRASDQLGGDFGWLYRAVTGETKLEIAAE